ncbi:hypothetical protein GOP47_0030708 [Adiantum capillus-veneris]|nr:hypothetical protein GOP47_0030708 [Adiantum capillus-veneris]
MRSIVKRINALDVKSGNASVAEKVLLVGDVPSDAHASVYFAFQPPPTLEVNIAAIAGPLKIKIKAADMSEPIQEHTFCCARACLDAVGKLQRK